MSIFKQFFCFRGHRPLSDVSFTYDILRIWTVNRNARLCWGGENYLLEKGYSVLVLHSSSFSKFTFMAGDFTVEQRSIVAAVPFGWAEIRTLHICVYAVYDRRLFHPDILKRWSICVSHILNSMSDKDMRVVRYEKVLHVAEYVYTCLNVSKAFDGWMSWMRFETWPVFTNRENEWKNPEDVRMCFGRACWKSLLVTSESECVTSVFTNLMSLDKF